MIPLAFLNLGASEVILILVVVLVLFGADKAPQLARSLGQARAKLDRARNEMTEALKSDDERAWDEQLSFERERERKVAEMAAPAPTDRPSLERAAEGLGLQTQGLSDEELKDAIRARLGGP